MHNCAGSSEALLSGQRPPFALAAAVIEAESGKRREDIQVAVSDCFVVSADALWARADRSWPATPASAPLPV
jgi:hypothetical protein